MKINSERNLTAVLTSLVNVALEVSTKQVIQLILDSRIFVQNELGSAKILFLMAMQVLRPNWLSRFRPPTVSFFVASFGGACLTVWLQR